MQVGGSFYGITDFILNAVGCSSERNISDIPQHTGTQAEKFLPCLKRLCPSQNAVFFIMNKQREKQSRVHTKIITYGIWITCISASFRGVLRCLCPFPSSRRGVSCTLPTARPHFYPVPTNAQLQEQEFEHPAMYLAYT